MLRCQHCPWAGAATALIGRRRRRKGQAVVPLDRFAYGFLFALALAAVRYLGTR